MWGAFFVVSVKRQARFTEFFHPVLAPSARAAPDAGYENLRFSSVLPYTPPKPE